MGVPQKIVHAHYTVIRPDHFKFASYGPDMNLRAAVKFMGGVFCGWEIREWSESETIGLISGTVYVGEHLQNTILNSDESSGGFHGFCRSHTAFFSPTGKR